MESKIFADKYKLTDTIFHSELQNIYVVEDINCMSENKLLLNEIIDSSIIYALKDVFNEDFKLWFKNFIDVCYLDSKLYIVSSFAPGTPLAKYLSSNCLRISDKMYIMDHLLDMLCRFDDTNRFFKYKLLNMESIMVGSNKSISFNLNFEFDKEEIYITMQDLMNKLSDVICSIFANTPYGTLKQDKDSLPPSISSIASKCTCGSYNCFDSVYKDFKASLLFSTFIIGSSIDKQVMKNIQKAKHKRSLRPVKHFACLLVIAALLVGGYYAWSNRNTVTPTAVLQNQIPIASFSLSKSKVYAGDQIDFVSEASDPDLKDKITVYEWTVSKDNGEYILFSKDEDPSYLFDCEGKYTVSLIVNDSSGASSNAYLVKVVVYPKEEIPEDTGDKSQSDNDILK